MIYPRSTRWAGLLTACLVLTVLFSAGVPIACAQGSRTTATPSTEKPDQVCLTWSADPGTTQTVQWRTSPKAKNGLVQFREKSADKNQYVEKTATEQDLEDQGTTNDPVNHRFTAVLDGLKPATAYTYRVGGDGGWSDWFDFTTAPQTAVPFSFVYMGDPQVGLEWWGKLLHAADAKFPNTAFYALAGDTVNAGNLRNLWDEFFTASTGVFDRRPVVPTLGNHDYSKEHDPFMYTKLFALPENGPAGSPPERNYTLRYSNALLLVLDSNQPTKQQAEWIDSQLAHTDATWKLALYHHPMYVSKANRDNEEIREFWMPVFDKYHLDMALQGHDHAYLRTYPMKEGHRVDSPKDGTVYVVSVSGTKHYEQDQHDYTEVGFTKTSTYQVLDIGLNPNRLTYRAYDIDGNVKDELTIEK